MHGGFEPPASPGLCTKEGRIELQRQTDIDRGGRNLKINPPEPRLRDPLIRISMQISCRCCCYSLIVSCIGACMYVYLAHAITRCRSAIWRVLFSRGNWRLREFSMTLPDAKKHHAERMNVRWRKRILKQFRGETFVEKLTVREYFRLMSPEMYRCYLSRIVVFLWVEFGTKVTCESWTWVFNINDTVSSVWMYNRKRSRMCTVL